MIFYTKYLTITNLIIFASLIFHLISPYFSIGFYAMDEHFQILEPLAYKLKTREANINEIWEFGSGLRPWFQTYIYLLIVKSLIFLNLENVYIWIYVIQVTGSLLGWFSLLLFYNVLKKYFSLKSTNFNNFIFFLFWFNIFLHSRTSSENLSISLFIIAFCLIILTKKSKTILSKSFLFSGLIFGFSILIRYQVIFLIGPLFIWLIFYYKSFFKIFSLGIIVNIVLLFGIYIDYLGYGYYNNTYYNYYYYNLVIGIFNNFGIEPWWFYIYQISIKLAPPIGAIFILSMSFYWLKNIKSFLTWITLPYFLIFCYLGHKELRFIFPIFVFTPLFLIWFLDFLASKKKFKLKKFIKYIIVITNVIFLIICFIPAERQIALYKFISKQMINENLYFYEKNPYVIDDLNPYFYTSSLPNIKKFISLNQIVNNNNTEDYYIITQKFNFYKSLINKNKCKKIYSTYPEEIISKNPNWEKRNFNWFVIKCLH